jgi:hypothetical protein
MGVNVRHSFSAYDQFANICERRFYYKYKLRRPEPPSVPLSVGILYHEALSAALQEPAAALDMDSFVERAKKTPMWAIDKPEIDLVQELQTNIDRVRRDVFPHLKPRLIEAWATKANGCAGKYTAKLDVLSDTTPVVDKKGVISGSHSQPCVIDWKTVSAAPKRSGEVAGMSAQLALYCLETGVHNAAFVEIPRSPAVPIATWVTSFDDYALRRWARHLDAQFAAMDTRGDNPEAYKLAAPGHSLCCPKWCPYWAECPGGENGGK